jgi:hypothetical protein
VLVAVCQGQRRDAAATEEERLGRFIAGQRKYIRLYRYSGKLALAAMNLRQARVAGRSSAAGAPPLAHVCIAGACDTTLRRGHPAALPGTGVWQHAWGDCAHCPSTAHHATFIYLLDRFPKF